MNKIKMALSVCLILALSGCFATGTKGSSSSNSKQQDIDKLVEMTVTKTFMEGYLKSYMDILSQNLPTGTPEEKAKFDRSMEIVVKILSDNIPELIEQIGPLYDKYYTHKEIKDMIAFYKSPTGQKAIKVMPALSQDAMQVGAKWGANLGPQVNKALMDAGIIK